MIHKNAIYFGLNIIRTKFRQVDISNLKLIIISWMEVSLYF